MEYYEKKYKNVLAKAREIHRNENEKRRDMEWLFPELKNKDEEIRKALIKGVESCKASGWTNFGNNVDIDVVLAWLEKQGDKDKLIKELGEYKVKYTQEVLSQQLEKQREQKSTSDTRYEVNAGNSLSVNGKPFDYEHATITQKDFAPKQEPKKIEDEIEIPFGAKDSELQEDTYYIPKGFHAEIDDDKVVIKKGEKSAAWNVEDSSKVQRICKYLDEAKKYYADITEVIECMDWLKSLKQRIGWKPSEEQMHAFIQVYVWYSNNFAPSETLTSLYNDLKKL